MEPVSKALLITSVSGVLAGAAGAVVAQATPILSGHAEQLTVVGAAVAGVLYLRSQNATLRTDLLAERGALAKLHEEQAVAAREASERLVSVIRDGHEAQAQLAREGHASQAQLTAAVNDMRVTMTGLQGVIVDLGGRRR